MIATVFTPSNIYVHENISKAALTWKKFYKIVTKQMQCKISIRENTFSNHLFCKRLNGFSLVEVTISLGLVSFALVAMLGLLPTGLTTLRAAMNQTVEAQILQSIASRAVISSFTNLTANTLYFDDEGLPVSGSDTAYYTADLTPGAASFPGSANTVALNNSLKNMKVVLVARPNPAAAGRTNIYSLQIANSGK